MNQIRFLVVLIFEAFVVVKAKECITPYKENATCLPIASCDVISSVLLTLTPRAIQFVKDSQCGCDGGMVCCGTSNGKPYPPLINCVALPERKIEVSTDTSICGLHLSTDRIRGGSLVRGGEFPWLAALEYKNKYTKANAGIRCGGSLISRRFVLTAAHCIWNVEFEIFKVWLGATNITAEETCSNTNSNIQCSKVQKLNVKRTITHVLYNSINKVNDIGLLQLEAEVKFSEYIRPICLPFSSSESLDLDTLLTVAGWGITENGKSSEVKLKVEVPLKDNSICEEYLSERFRNVTSKQLCVGGVKGQDSCEGDSGGPLMYDFIGPNDDVQWIQLGIVSYGAGCGIEGKPGVYVKVASYLNWIYNKVNNRTILREEGEPCAFKDGTKGTCVQQNRCPEIVNRIFTKSEYYVYQHNQDLQCSLQISSTLVCCKNPGSIISADLNTTSVILPDERTCGMVKGDSGVKDDKVNFPWTVGIEVSTGQGNCTKIRCIGTIIHSRYVLTTVQCVFGPENEKIEPTNVLLGRWNRCRHNDNPVRKIGIKKIIAYPFHNHIIENYIALILLENDIQFSDYIRPICLDSGDIPMLHDGENVTFLRMPLSISTGPTTSDTLIKQTLRINHSISGCGAYYIYDCVRPPVDTKPAPHGAPIMRMYEDPENGRIRWYLVATHERFLNFRGREMIKYVPNINTLLDWIITIISEYS